MTFCGNSTFWNWNQSVHSSWPRLPQCFQATVLVYTPAIYLVLATLAYIPNLLTLPRMLRPRDSPLSIAKTVISIALTAVSIAAIITEVFSEPSPISFTAEEFHPVTSSRYVAKAVEMISYMTTAFLVQMEKQRSVMTSGVLFTYWLLLLVCDTPPMLTYLEIKMYSVSPPRFVLFLISMMMIGTQFILNCFADTRIAKRTYRSKDNSPDLTASFLSRLVFFWMSRLLYTGYKRPLRPSDLWNIKHSDNCRKVLSRFETARQAPIYESYGSHISSINKNKIKNNLRLQNKPMDDLVNSSGTSFFSDSERVPLLSPISTQKTEEDTDKEYKEIAQKPEGLFQILIRAFGKEVFISYVCKFVSDTLQFAAPFLLKELIDYVSQDATGDVERHEWHAYVVVAAMFLSAWLQTVFYHQHFHLAMTSGMRMKAALMAAIYKKSLRLSNSGRQVRSSGEVVNLMSVDAQRVQEMMSYTWMVWSIPYQIALAVFLLWDTMGVPVLAGVGLLMMLIPFNAILAYQQQRMQRVNLKWKDKRIKLLGEVLAGMKVLKLYTWEDVFCKKIQAIRQEEVKVLTKLAWLSAGGTFMWTCAPYLVSLVSFGTFILMSPTAVLTAQIAFITLSLFNILQFPVAFIPECVNFTSQAAVAIRRINEFLNEKEMDRKGENSSPQPQYTLRDPTSQSDHVAVCIERGIFAWDESDYYRLQWFHLSTIFHSPRLVVSKGSLTAVVGAVGSGKTSLLLSLLGEMDKIQGDVILRGTTAYVPQTAWIQNATIQENILIGHTFHQRMYKNVMRACALEADMKTLPCADLTAIGEKGANLSGGQRQRVGLARALYSDADVYILDDPLSAVDSTVGKQIFKRVLSERGFLKNKTRILATHAIQWLPLVDHIVFMQGGRVVETGTYLELTMRDGQFMQFLRREVTKESDEELGSQDEEVRNMKKTMREHIESITSCSESATSGDEIKWRQARHIPNGQGPSQVNTNRHDSTTTSTEKTPHPICTMNAASGFVEQENLEDGNVRLSVYGKYCKNIGYCCTIIIIALFAAYEVSGVLANLWLAKWTGDELFYANDTRLSVNRRLSIHYLAGYGIFGAFQVFFIFIYAFLVAVRMVHASARLHNAMLTRVLRAPMSFFDTTPTGRILNRFSRDMENIDNELPQVLLMFIMCVFSVTSTFVVISLQSVMFVSVIVPLFIMYWAIQRFFVRTSRQLKRMEAVSRSPIFTQFSETLNGCRVIRAFDRSRWFETEFSKRVNQNNVFYFAGISANRWLGVWIEFISSLVVLATTVFLLNTPGVDGATLGLAVTYALQITQALKWLVRTMSDIETNAVSLERVLEFTRVPQEKLNIPNEGVPSFWPVGAEIIFSHVTTSYRPGLDPVLKDVNFVIRPGEKIGIVGRTGAGKSSLTLALFRIIEIDAGDITIDNVNIKDIGLSTLRSAIAILPQDPVLISGNLRANLDPKGEHHDEAIWKALTFVNLKSAVAALPDQLGTDVGENGSKFSNGQKQLFCLARALLKSAKVLVMDEPTSSVDADTDAIVQHTISKAFRGSTTITIAHRIPTILDCDRVMVLDAGRVVEFDPPMQLLKDPDSHFTALARGAGCKTIRK